MLNTVAILRECGVIYSVTFVVHQRPAALQTDVHLVHGKLCFIIIWALGDHKKLIVNFKIISNQLIVNVS